MSKTAVTKKIKVPGPKGKAKNPTKLKPFKVEPKAKHDLTIAPQFGDVVEGQ